MFVLGVDSETSRVNGESFERAIVAVPDELYRAVGYAELVHDCRLRIADMLETYWEIGREIHVFLDRSDHQQRYGRSLIKQLAKDTCINMGTLYHAHQFYRVDPDQALLAELQPVPWSRIRRLVPLLRPPEARAAVRAEIDEIAGMSEPGFESWLARAHQRLLGKPLKRRGRKPGSKTSARAHLKGLKELAMAGGFAPSCARLERGRGHVVAFAFGGNEDPIAILKSLLATARAEELMGE